MPNGVRSFEARGSGLTEGGLDKGARHPAPSCVRLGEIELHYIQKGRGDPIVLLHGGTGDYRSWLSHVDYFAAGYHVFAYSRRYSFPNTNGRAAANHSASVEASDLAALLRSLDVGAAHLVGTSYGALTALTLATREPRNVRSLVLVEPPMHSWIRETAVGASMYEDFIRRIWRPAGFAFRQGHAREAMRILVDGFSERPRFNGLASEASDAIMQNASAMEALVLSSDPFSTPARDVVRRLAMPVLILCGEHTTPIHKLATEELGHTLPHAARAIIPGAGHASPQDKPFAFAEAVRLFLSIA
jgi:pimeloyl-ACP methyl ester carboxylesterase